VDVGASGKFPTAIDINPTARCNLQCSFCWGPDHAIPDGLTLGQWKDALGFFRARGTVGVVVTGGEPLIREDLPAILAHAKALGLHVTLSTNALLLNKRHESVLSFVDEIGLPLDGSSAENNQKMRRGTQRSFGAVIDALPLVRARYPNIEITIRTVVSRVNIADIEDLGRLLEGRADYFDRWKLYQFTPFSIGEAHRDEHAITDGEFLALMERVRRLDGLGGRALGQMGGDAKGRYLFVGPLGDVYGVNDVGTYGMAGSLLNDPPEALAARILACVDQGRNTSHAKSPVSLRVLSQT